MLAGNTSKSAPLLAETQLLEHRPSLWFSRKIWIPKLLYAALPFFYLAAGSLALLASLYIGNWTWILPHYLFFSVACLHMGWAIYRRRRQRDNRDA